MSYIILYIDPGTGSLLLQMLIGGIAGLIVFIKKNWNRIYSFFKKIKNTNNQ
jgi:hypothetical protein